jgi:hypothetical protein
MQWLSSLGKVWKQKRRLTMKADGGAAINKRNEIAADWWANVLRPGTKQDNGDSDLMTGMLVAMCAAILQPTSEQIQTFRDELKAILDSGNVPHHLACDYHCEGILDKAASVAGIRNFCPPFPMKTIMWIEENSLSVSYGYGAARRFLWINDKAWELKAKVKDTGEVFSQRCVADNKDTAMGRLWCDGSEEYYDFISLEEIPVAALLAERERTGANNG